MLPQPAGCAVSDAPLLLQSHSSSEAVPRNCPMAARLQWCYVSTVDALARRMVQFVDSSGRSVSRRWTWLPRFPGCPKRSVGSHGNRSPRAHGGPRGPSGDGRARQRCGRPVAERSALLGGRSRLDAKRELAAPHPRPLAGHVTRLATVLAVQPMGDPAVTCKRLSKEAAAAASQRNG